MFYSTIPYKLTIHIDVCALLYTLPLHLKPIEFKYLNVTEFRKSTHFVRLIFLLIIPYLSSSIAESWTKVFDYPLLMRRVSWCVLDLRISCVTSLYPRPSMTQA